MESVAQYQLHLQQISDLFLINGGYLDNPGLYTGEMGLALFFARYARFTQNELYADFCYDLLDRVKRKIYKETSINYKAGLAGIGAVIEYLVQNDYFEADTDDILEDFDNRIFFTYNLSNLPVDQIADIGYYALWRLSGNSALKDATIKNVLSLVIEIIDDWNGKQQMTHPVLSFFSSENRNILFGNTMRQYWLQLCRQNKPYFLKEEAFTVFSDKITKNDFLNNRFLPLGIKDGLAGWGLSVLTRIDGDDSWLALFPNDLQPE